MNDFFGTTAAIDELTLTPTLKRRTFWKTIFSFFIIYLLGSILSGIISMIPMYSAMMNDPGVREVLYSENPSDTDLTNAMLEVMNNLPQWMNAVSLLATAGLIFAVLFYSKKFENRRFATLGFIKKGAVSEYGIGIIVGLILFVGAYGIMLLSGEAQFFGFSDNISLPMLLLFFLGFLVQGMSEEILLRGYLFVSLSSTNNVPIAIIVNSFIFTWLHSSNSGVNTIAFLNLFLFGVLASLYFLRRGSIWGIAAVHSIWNFAQGNIFGCQVSGNNTMPSLFNTVYTTGNGLFNGGAFGPEGGLGVTIILLIGIVVLLFMKNKDVEIPMVRYFGEFQSDF